MPRVPRSSLSAPAHRLVCPFRGETKAAGYTNYWRTISDLPWVGRSIHLFLYVRRFRCANPACPLRISAERIPYARKTALLNEVP